MAKTTCAIEFDNNPQKVYFGGQLMSGRVILTLHKAKLVRGALLKCKLVLRLFVTLLNVCLSNADLIQV